MTTKSIHQSAILEALITSQARIAVLTLLMLNTENRYYLREIESLTQQPVRAVQRELSRLTRAALVISTPEGNRKYYQANRSSPVFAELKGLIAKTTGLGRALREHLARSADAIDVALIFGSYAKGQESPASDIDLLVIGDISGRELSGVLGPAREAMLREINTIIMSKGEAQRRFKNDDPFLLEIYQEPKIILIGDEDEFRKILARR